MELNITKDTGMGPACVLRLQGTLDGSTYLHLIDEAQKAYDAGVRDLVLDLSLLGFISSAGLSALHRIARLFGGETDAIHDEGWAAYRAIDRDRARGFQQHVRLVGPSKKVLTVLDMVGFTQFFMVYADMQQAQSSFRSSTKMGAAIASD